MSMLQEAVPPRRQTGSHTVVVVPVYNEEGTVVQVLTELLPLVDEIVVVDDGSTDRSRELIIGWATGRPNVQTILFDRNQGLSAAYYAAFKAIGQRVGAGDLDPDDLVLTVDADGQHDPADLGRLLARVKRDGFDAAVARRDLSGYRPIKRAGNNLLSLWASLWAGTRLYDVESGFRVFRAGPLIEALQYYHGYRYSETVEVAVVLPRLGYRLSNDVLVPVPVQRSRTSIRDGVIDALAMIGAWWRVYAGRNRPADMPAWSLYIVPALAMLAILFAAGDILRTPMFLASDSMHNYAHVWYLSDQIFHHARIPLHFSLLDGGRAMMFPYAIVPYVLGALTFPVLGNWGVSLLMVAAVIGMVWAAGLARPEMRDPWMIALLLLNPWFIDAVFAFQFASVWSAFFFLLFVWAFERRRYIPSGLLLWLCVSSHPLMGSLAVAAYGLFVLIWRREYLRPLVLASIPVGLALIPVYLMILSTPSLDDDPGAFVRTTLSTIGSRTTYFAAPFVIAALAPWLRRNYRPALVLGLASAVAGVLLLGGIFRYHRAPSGYYGVFRDSSDVYAEYFASPQFRPGMTYRILEPSEREDGMYRFIRHGAVLSNEFYTESTMQRWWNVDQYACYTAFKSIDFVVIEQAWENRVHFNERQLLQSLVAQGQATLAYDDPAGRFQVYDIQPFVSSQNKPASLSQCSL